jgi:uncharacterized protein YbaR (Trm112 family)
MPVDKKLLEILCCPETKSPVLELDAVRLEQLNNAVTAGKVTNKGGEPVTEAVPEALITEDGATIYEVRDGIPIMLIEKGIDATVIG